MKKTKADAYEKLRMSNQLNPDKHKKNALGISTNIQWLAKTKGNNWKDLMIQEIREEEERSRLHKEV